MLGSIRRHHQVKLPAVRQAIDYLRQVFKSDHPLLEKKMLTDGSDLFIEQYEHIVNISRQGQMVMKQVMDVPKIRFGKPCIRGTRIPTAIIVERHQAGDSILLLAEDYGRKAEEIEEAIRYEGRIAS